jgi:hypothetical protein
MLLPPAVVLELTKRGVFPPEFKNKVTVTDSDPDHDFMDPHLDPSYLPANVQKNNDIKHHINNRSSYKGKYILLPHREKNLST